MAYMHKVHGWTREHIGFDEWRIVPTDGSGDRVVAMLSAHTWQNHPNDRREDSDKDRVVLVSGAELPDWCRAWLEQVNARSCARAREAFRAAVDDADNAPFRDGGW